MPMLTFALIAIALLLALPLVGLYLLGRFLFPEGSTRDYDIEPAAEASRGLSGAVVWRVWQKWMKDKPRQIARGDKG